MSNKIDRDTVARLAGVSTATVSRVYNHPDKVSTIKKDLVLKAAASLGYEPNRSASILAKGIHGRLLLLDSGKLLKYDRSNSSYYSWLYVEILKEIGSLLKETPYQLVLGDRSLLDTEDKLSGFDGIICFDIDSEEDLQIVEDSQIPFVYGHHVRDMRDNGAFWTDNHYGAFLQARYLKETGHRSVIYMTGLLDRLNSHKERLSGFKEIYPSEKLTIVESPMGKEGGARTIAPYICDIQKGKYDAIAVVNDLTAVGVYFELMENGIRIPEDISLIGYDNLPFTSLLPKRLSTIDIKIGHLYKEMTHSLIKHIKGDSKVDSKGYRPSLVRGETVTMRSHL